MKLPPIDANRVIILHKQLLLYANNNLQVISGIQTMEDLMKVKIEQFIKIRDALHSKPEIIENFVTQNPYKLPKKQLEIVSGWRNPVRGSFFILKHLKNYSIFLDADDPPHAYGVLSLTEDLQDILGPEIPQQVKTVLIPYKDRIVFDGLLVKSRIIFGRGFSSDLNEQYRKAKFRYGIITSIPWKEEKTTSNEDQLKFYMKSFSSLEQYWYEIEDLIDQYPPLEKIYHLRLSKLYSRKLKTKLKKIGVKDAWFAVLDNLIVTSGSSRKQVNENLREIIPDRASYAYVFHLKQKQNKVNQSKIDKSIINS